MKLAMAACMLAQCLLAPRAQAHGGAHGEHGAHRESAASAKAVKLSDAVLQDQNDGNQRLASDAIADKLAVVTFVCTNCADACPTVSHTFEQLQGQLGGLLDPRVRLISLSIAPARDTPQRLNDYACPNPAWLWLTGDRESVSTALLSGKEQAMQPQREEPSRGPGRGRASRKEQ